MKTAPNRDTAAPQSCTFTYLLASQLLRLNDQFWSRAWGHWAGGWATCTERSRSKSKPSRNERSYRTI